MPYKTAGRQVILPLKIMTSEDRHRARYLRRVVKREANRKARANEYTLENVFTFSNLYKAGKKCCNGVRWKQSTQNFERHLFSRTAVTRKKILEGKWKPGRYSHFTLSERGKTRPIDAPVIGDRQVHKVLSQEVLLPLYRQDMIYNNGASLKGKGFHFTLNMVKNDLRAHFRKYGMSGYVVLFDFRHFFPSASHDAVRARHDRLLPDNGIKVIANRVLDSTEEGLPLGVEVSQVEMVALPSGVDNYIKCQLGIKRIGHYMDDYYMLLPPDADPESIMEKVIAKAEKDGFHINPKKVQTLRFGKPFKFCKAKFFISDTGKVTCKGNPKSFTAAMRKAKALMKKSIKEEDLNVFFNSIKAYFENYDNHYKVLKVKKLWKECINAVRMQEAV